VLTLTHTELVHFVRPSADLLFESMAASYRSRAIAVVLSGTGSDGAMGVTAVKKMGGIVIVQDPAQCEFSGMPLAAQQTGGADLVLGLEDMELLADPMAVDHPDRRARQPSLAHAGHSRASEPRSPCAAARGRKGARSRRSSARGHAHRRRAKPIPT